MRTLIAWTMMAGWCLGGDVVDMTAFEERFELEVFSQDEPSGVRLDLTVFETDLASAASTPQPPQDVIRERPAEVQTSDDEIPFPSILFFTQPGCGGCGVAERDVLPWLRDAGWTIYVVDWSDTSRRDLFDRFDVQSTPTLLVYRKGREFARYAGYTIAGFSPVLNAACATAPVASDAAPTPASEVDRALALLPTPETAFVDFGCGPDARVVIEAARRWKRKAIGVEIDPENAAAARQAVADAGVADLVTIVEGDAREVEVDADVGYCYLYPQLLAELIPRLTKLRAFASYQHQPPGLYVWNYSGIWVWKKPVAAATRRGVMWTDGRVYYGRVCNDPTCQMCNYIEANQ